MLGALFLVATPSGAQRSRRICVSFICRKGGKSQISTSQALKGHNFSRALKAFKLNAGFRP